MQEVLAFEEATVRRQGKDIVKAVNWRVTDDQRWVILGANGAGKTTLLTMAAAQTHPSSGIVRVLGERLGRVDVFELRPRIGFASAALAERLPPHETVLDCVTTGAFGVTGRWNQRFTEEDVVRAQRLLAEFQMARFSSRSYGTLSEGERKRVQLCRSLMSDPELLLLDEPTAGLDLGGREELMDALTRLALDPAGPVMVLVTHRLEEIPIGFDRALLMRDGRALSAGPIESVLSDAALSATFGIGLRVTRSGKRWGAMSDTVR